jgi:hypothetical protein
VCMVGEVRSQHPTEWAAITAVAEKLGIGTAETLRTWVRRAEAGERPAGNSSESRRNSGGSSAKMRSRSFVRWGAPRRPQARARFPGGWDDDGRDDQAGNAVRAAQGIVTWCGPMCFLCPVMLPPSVLVQSWSPT